MGFFIIFVMMLDKNKYIEMMCKKLSININNLTDNERKLIEEGFNLLKEKDKEIQDLKLSLNQSYRNSFYSKNNDTNYYDDDDFDY